MRVDRQYFLFLTIKTDRGTISIKAGPFLHIEVASGDTKLMLPLEVMREAGRLIDGLSASEKSIIKKMLGGMIANENKGR
jgi:hypothetical protein